MGTKRPSCTISDTLSNINTSDRKLQPGGKLSWDPSPRPVKTTQSERERDINQEEDRRRERDMHKVRDKARYKDMDLRERYYERERATEREWRERRLEDDRIRNGRPQLNVEKDTEREVEVGMKKGDTFPRIRKSSPDHSRRMMSTTETYEERGERRQRHRPRRTEKDDWEREREKAWQREQYRGRERDEIRRANEEGKNTGARHVEDEKLRQREGYPESNARFQDRRREVGDLRDKRERQKKEKLRPNMAESEGKMPSPRRYRDREIYSDSKERQEVQRREGKRDTKSEGDGDERELRRERVRDKEREELMYKHSRSEGDNKGKRAKERDQDGQGHREDKQRNRGREIEVDRSRKRGVEKERGRYREADRRAAREADRGGETWKESREDLKDDRSEDDKYKEYKQRRDREIKEREADPRWDNTTGRSSRFLNETAPRVPRQTLSSGEWSSDIDTEMRHRSRHSYEERESGREGATADERDVEQRDPERTAERSQRAQKRSERQERDTGETTGSLSAQRRMWLEPQRGKNSKEEFVNREIHTRGKERKREEETGIESQGQWEREGRRVKEEPNETYSDQSSYRGKHGGRNEYRRDVEEKTEGVSVDGEEVGEVWRETDNGGKEQLSDNDEGIEGSQQRDAEGENVTDNIEDGDREEEGGTGYFRFESEGGSETGWKHDKDRMLSGEDDFLTLSSGGDEDDEDEKFEDCQEFWEGGLAYDDASPVGFSGCEGGKEWDKDLTTEKEETVDKEEPGREKQPKYVFCVIGQTLPWSHHDDMSPSQADEMGSVERDNSISERCHHYSDDTAQQSQDDMHPSLFRNDEYPAINNRETELQDTETREGLRSQVELPCAEILQIRRESQTEKLLIEWREKNKELADAERKQPSPVPSSAHICSEVNFEQIQSIVDGLNSGAISPEEIEAIRIQMSTAWSLSDEPKRHSQAPHLKWAKNVVCKILGHSQEQTVNKPNSQLQGDQGVNETETAIKNGKEQEVLAQGTKEIPVVKLTTNEHAESELEEDVPLEVEGLRGMGQSQGDMHADQFTTMHGDTPTHTLAETQLDREGVEDNGMEREIEPSGHLQLEKADREMKITQEGGDGEVMVLEIEKEEHRETEMELCLPESNMLYKHNSCPILNYESDSDLPVPFSESKKQEVEDGMGESEEEMPEKEPEEMGTTEEVGKTRVEEAVEVEGRGEVMAEGKIEGGTQMIDSFRDLGPEARMRRRGIRKTTERRNGELFEVKEEEGVARDRRTRIFSLTDDEDDSSRSLGGVELRNVLDTLQRHKRKSKFFNATQLYQQYNEAAQNFEILSQSRSDVLHVREGGTSSPAPSPPPARRPLPALPPVLHPHSFFQTGSITSIQSLPLPEPPKSEGRSPSPRLSISLTQSATLWRDLPGVRNSHELEELTEDQMRLQEVRFEVVTSEASYRRSLDIVVEHFVKSKQLGALLTTKDRNWLFSRLTDVRAVSHSFLSKLEERVESDILQFTVCDVIAQHCQRFKMVYVPYLTNQSYQDATFQRLMNENPRFRRIVEKLEASPVCQRLPLRSFLVLPFQRITRLKLLVQNIVKRTTPGTAEATQAIKALKLLEKLIQESNDSISQMKNIESLVTLSARVDFECRTLPLISQSRRLVKEGPVTELMDFSLKETERSVYLHLFNDYLLLSLQKEGGRFIVIDHSPVVDVHVENCRAKRLTSQKNLFRLRVAQKSLLLWTDTESDKLRWISALSRPHPEIDFSAAQDYPQMQCIRAFTAQQPDELSLEKADIILVHKQSSDHWVEGTRLTDRHRGWVPESHLETISSSRVKQRNLSDALKLTTATAAV